MLCTPFLLSAGQPKPQSLPGVILLSLNAAKYPSFVSSDWYKVLEWLKDKTPDSGLNYYELYKEPGINKETGKINDYNYPSSAYGVLARWDMGHAIEYYSHRIPIANNFQQGIGYINNDGSVVPGEATFFLETDENKAYSYLDELRSKYIIVDPLFVDPNGEFKIEANYINNGDLKDYTSDKIEPTKFDSAISTRMYFYDGSNVSFSKKLEGKESNYYIPSLDRLRLLYESDTNVAITSYNGQNTTKQVKVFEYVKGAIIKGTAASGTKVSISTEVTTNQGRKFTYEDKATAEDGSFEFTVPYSTGKQENYDITAGDYTIKIGGYTESIKVSEADILKGETIEI